MKKKDRFSELHSEYYPLVSSVVYSKTGNTDDTFDICQEIFIKFFNSLDKIQDHRKWLYGTLRHTVYDYYRQKRGEDADIDDFNYIGLSFVNGFRDARIIISEAFDSIENFGSEKDRTMFDLIAVHNYSYNEAAAELGLTKRKVEYRYRHIVEQIIDYLSKKGIKDIEELL